MTNWARSLLNYWHAENEALGLESDVTDMGGAGEYQGPFAGFLLANVQRKRDVRTAYDPVGVFKRLNCCGFKLGD